MTFNESQDTSEAGDEQLEADAEMGQAIRKVPLTEKELAEMWVRNLVSEGYSFAQIESLCRKAARMAKTGLKKQNYTRTDR